MSRTPRERASAEAGFTPNEILVVIVVIAVLARMVAPNVFKHVGESKSVSAHSQIEMLGAALDSCRLDSGRYPSTAQGLAALWTAPALHPRPLRWRGPYLRNAVPLGPWGRPYIAAEEKASQTSEMQSTDRFATG